jgi:PAS domain S-box-containing protein/putative nucleotidyltransferase with HDIG domain
VLFRSPATLNYITDITERKRAEETLKKSEENYRRLFDSSPVAIYQVDFKTGKFLKANDVICEYFGCNHEEIISHSPYDLLTDESKQLFLERLSKMSLGEKVTETPEYEIIDKNGQRRWLQLSSKNIYDSEGLIGADVVAHDITERKRAEERLKETLERLRKSFGTTIHVLVSAVETRDPYTSGHQIRVANIARAIATEMGLPHEKIDGLRMAGSIHDIGKLSIPAEILSKPVKLSDIEFSLIKEHARKGYEMLKDVESPWPLAQIVYQHHERMDGSGYPRGLKGDEIIIEARIMAVADVVESMASHRPYRPALGIEVALEEIEKNKGTLYDQAVADTCLKLFRKKGFKLEWA